MKYKPGTFSVTPNKELMRGKPTELQTVHFWLCDRADENGICFPSRPKIAEDAGIKSVRTVDKYIKALEEIGILVKTKRRQTGDVKNNSNLYQIMVVQEMQEGNEQEMLDPSAIDALTPRAPNSTVTIPTTVNTQLTKVVKVKPSEPSVRTDGQIPGNRGNTYVKRILSVYYDLFRNKFGFEPTVDVGRIGKTLKALCVLKSELQVSALLISFFDWMGMEGNDSKEQQRLVSAAFPLTWFFAGVSSYEAYLRNVYGLKLDDEQEVRAFVGKTMSSLSTA